MLKIIKFRNYAFEYFYLENNLLNLFNLWLKLNKSTDLAD